MGRKPCKGRKPLRGKYKPRVIDLDLLFFDKEVINTRVADGAASAPARAPLRPRADGRAGARADASEAEQINFRNDVGAEISFRVSLARAELLRPQPAKRPALAR